MEVEIPIFDPDTVDIPYTQAILKDTGLETIGCNIMAGDRNPIDEDPAIRENGKNYLKRTIEVIAELGADTLVGPMYSAVGKLVGRGRNQQEWEWCVAGVTRGRRIRWETRSHACQRTAQPL